MSPNVCLTVVNSAGVVYVVYVCNQIDHITIRREWRRSLLNVQAYRGADVMSYHFLVRATLKIKIMIYKRV
jgi:hypothetical protein